MNIKDIEVGGIYRIRQWEDMAEEFGEEGGGGIIPCDGAFVEGMSYLCGEEVEVLGKRESYAFYIVDVRWLNTSLDHHDRTWTITPDMLEPCEPEEELPNVDPASIFVLLGG